MTPSPVIEATLFSDPACPWGYSENPALRVIEWRYGAQIDWKLVLVGLSENTQRYLDNGFTPLRITRSTLRFLKRMASSQARVLSRRACPPIRITAIAAG